MTKTQSCKYIAKNANPLKQLGSMRFFTIGCILCLFFVFYTHNPLYSQEKQAFGFDLKKVPFSTRGAYFSISHIKDRKVSDSLFLHHFIGMDTRTLFSFHPTDAEGNELFYHAKASPSSITLSSLPGKVRICFEDSKTIRIKLENISLRLETDAFRIPMYLSDHQFRLPGYNRYDRLMISCTKGSVSVQENQQIDESKFDLHHQTRELGTDYISLYPGEDGIAELVLEEYVSEWKPRKYGMNYDACEAETGMKFDKFLRAAPPPGKEFSAAYQLAMYINWSSMVRPRGVMCREGMLMSKNWMNYLWSWDNCFNAMAMAHSHPIVAWNQIMVEFDNQDELGILPDRFRDVFIHYGFTKPPVYGIALNNMRKTGILGRDHLLEVYEPLKKLTNFWLKYRDDDKDGLPQYHHGNDSGWDNGTVFDVGYPVEGPDLASFLVLQMDELAEIAMILGKHQEAREWKKKADETVGKILEEFWKEGGFVYLKYPGGAWNKEGNSLLAYIPMLLGDRLPASIRTSLVNSFKEADLITEYGVATESVNSPLYQPDGYWRGPIWAPSTFLIVEGLKNCGEEELAKEIAYRFCKTCKKSGFAENFNALSGDGLRDPAYTWTASVFLSFLYEYGF